MNDVLAPWQVTAVNLPEHARNPIHTDAGGRAAGFPGALVAGVTVYGYLSHVPMTAWGERWLGGGTAEVRFHQPVFDHDLVDCEPVDHDGVATIEARTTHGVRASSTVGLDGQEWAGALRDGERLAPLVTPLEGQWRGYGARIGDDLGLYDRDEVVHPAVWPALANQVMYEQLVTGPWIHTRSQITHHAVARLGGTATVESSVIDRYESRIGRRAVADMVIRVDDQVVASIEHEAIVELTPAD